jgi:hypothetical protein
MRQPRLNVSTDLCCSSDLGDGRYSNQENYANGYGQNGKGTANPKHEDTRQWSEKQAAETGLVHREKL